MMEIPSTFDCLRLISSSSECSNEISPPDVFLLAYLASLLAMYDCREDDNQFDWGYAFSATPYGTPFSGVLDSAMERLLELGKIAHETSGLRLTDQGEDLLRLLSELNIGKQRRKYIEPAVTTAVILPIGEIRAALALAPERKLALAHKSTRFLATGHLGTQLAMEFNAVADALDSAQFSLLAVSVVWLSYNCQQHRVG
ncbi:MAG: hypothetical protein OXH72_01295 [Caldilineaceae bacterium]|nr:hypothetical protein [Caldilineaceae bacterium]